MNPSWLSSINSVESLLTLEDWYFRRNQYILRFCDKSSVEIHKEIHLGITSLYFLSYNQFVIVILCIFFMLIKEWIIPLQINSSFRNVSMMFCCNQVFFLNSGPAAPLKQLCGILGKLAVRKNSLERGYSTCGRSVCTRRRQSTP